MLTVGELAFSALTVMMDGVRRTFAGTGLIVAVTLEDASA
jgi:hypothetical protein